jgi:peptidyl-prolyl cis-trans isomerase A (cyclophilin A)
MKSYLSAAFLSAAILAAYGQTVITSGPNNLTINAGSTASFTVTATNATSYQWIFQGTNIAGATNSQYLIENTATNQEGVYSVMAGGPAGTNLASATLTVLQGTIVNFQITGFRNGSSNALLASNVLVELFDHDKPATVQNFIHYIRSGAYLNMFFDRLIPGFVLQGGGWWAQDKTNSIPLPSVNNIYDYFVEGMHVNSPGLPEQVDSEFYVGPQVSNTKGTLAMALPAGNADGAANDFFFNLVDNAELDTTNTGGGPFTVFGRVLSGTDVLDFFNNTNEFSKPSITNISSNNIFTNGIFDEAYFDTNATSFSDLPLNYHGTNLPADSNLFFVNFTFPNPKAQPLIVTNPPTAAITFPAVNSVVPNGTSLTIQGTAQAVMGGTALSLDGAVVKVPVSERGDDGVAMVYCMVSGYSTIYATGATNWSAFFGVLPLGIYNILVTADDGAGNQGPIYEVTNGTPIPFLKQQMIISAVAATGVGFVSATNVASGGFVTNAIGSPLLDGFTYDLGAQPGSGQSFLNWTVGGNVVGTNPVYRVAMSDSLFVTANFTGRVAFSYPPLGGYTSNGDFSIQGAIYGPANLPLTLQCQLFSFTNQPSPANQPPPLETMLTNASTTWSFPVTNLPLGHYFVKVTATDTEGNTTFITNDFTAGLPVTVFANGNGRGTITASFASQELVEGQTYYAAEGAAYSLRAAPASGSVFDSWYNGSTYTNNETCRFIMAPGLAFTATFVSNDFPGTVSNPILITNPAAGAKLTNTAFELAGTINPALTNPVVSYQLFRGSNSVTPPSTNVSINPSASRLTKTTWSVPLTNLVPGHYTVVATLSDTLGRSTVVTENFQILAQLSLQITPPESGRLSSNWTGQYVPVGTSCTVTARTNGGYVFAYWSDAAGENESNPVTFTVTTNVTVTANFVSNYFYNVAGTYHGLFYPTNENSTASNSGYYTLTVTSNAAVSLKVGFPAFTNSASGAFPLYNPSGYASYSVPWQDPNGGYVTNSASLNLTNATITNGYVASSRFFSPLSAFRAATKLTAASPVLPGTNVFSIPGDHTATSNQPDGDGYASFTLNSSGAVKLIGYLADNTSFSQSTQIVTNDLDTNGILPFYASLYGGKGIILGWQTNTSPTSFSGQLAWSKPAKTGAYYTNGFVLTNNASSDGYIPPANGTRYQIAFSGATLTNGLTNTLTVTNGIFAVDPDQTTNLNLELTFTTSGSKTGAVSGSFSYPSSKSDHKFYGAFASPALGGSGYFLDTNSQTGWFEITLLHP